MGKNISLTIEATDAIVAQFESFVTSHGLKPGEALEILLESYGEGAEEPNEEDLEAIGRGLAEVKAGLGTPLEDFITERRLERAALLRRRTPSRSRRINSRLHLQIRPSSNGEV